MANEAMQVTASEPDGYAWSVCRRNRILRGMHSGLVASWDRTLTRGAGLAYAPSDDVGRSLKQDRARKAKKTVRSGQGDKGDQKRRS